MGSRADEMTNYPGGVCPSGPHAKDLLEFFATADGKLTDEQLHLGVARCGSFFVDVTSAFPLVASARCRHLLCCLMDSLISCPRAPSGLTR